MNRNTMQARAEARAKRNLIEWIIRYKPEWYENMVTFELHCLREQERKRMELRRETDNINNKVNA